jgi:hypothetical protein
VEITDRLTKAVEQLGNQDPSARLGGIFSLDSSFLLKADLTGARFRGADFSRAVVLFFPEVPPGKHSLKLVVEGRSSEGFEIESGSPR